jgi:hypothetical protein
MLVADSDIRRVTDSLVQTFPRSSEVSGYPTRAITTDVEGRHVNTESQSDYLLMVIFVLGSICIMRSTYLIVPQTQDNEISIQHSPDDQWTSPL